MKAFDFERQNPVATAVFFLSATVTVMLCADPVIYLFSFIGAIGLCVLCKAGSSYKYNLAMAGLFILIALLNPLTNHRGDTALFFINDNAVTLEAVLYGASQAVMVVSVIYWFASFTKVMTSDRLLYVLGAFSPKISLLLSMTLRYIPLFGRQAKRITEARRAVGMAGSDSIADRLREGGSLFSVMTTWALENGIITADSMTCRGYGTEKRTFFSLFRFRTGDVILTVLSPVLAAAVIAAYYTGNIGITFYPAVTLCALTPVSAAAYASYLALTLIPFIITVRESIRWKFLKSKI